MTEDDLPEYSYQYSVVFSDKRYSGTTHTNLDEAKRSAYATTSYGWFVMETKTKLESDSDIIPRSEMTIKYVAPSAPLTHLIDDFLGAHS